MRNSHSLAPAYGGMPRAIGRGRTNLLSRTRAPAARGCTPTCIARKAIRTTQSIGMVGRGNLFAENHSTRNGSGLQEICWDKYLLLRLWDGSGLIYPVSHRCSASSSFKAREVRFTLRQTSLLARETR